MKKKKIVLRIAAAVLLCLAGTAAAVVLLKGHGQEYTINKADTKKNQEIPPAFALLEGEEMGYSVLYPKELTAEWKKQEGTYIYFTESGKMPYVLIQKASHTKLTPERYFDSCNRMMQQTFEQVASTKIQEVWVEGKTLYMTRYRCSQGKESYVIDRYLELYPEEYIEYTALSMEAGSLNTPLYYAIATLRLQKGAYEGMFSPKTKKYTHSELGLVVEIPKSFEVKDLTIGYFAFQENAMLLTIVCEQGEHGEPVRTREDFLQLAAQSERFVPDLLGVETASFSEGSRLTMAGLEFYSYPMTMTMGEASYQGAIYLADRAAGGCYLFCYGVLTESEGAEELGLLCKKGIEEIKIK